jgi:hypothetical protein
MRRYGGALLEISGLDCLFAIGTFPRYAGQDYYRL